MSSQPGQLHLRSTRYHSPLLRRLGLLRDNCRLGIVLAQAEEDLDDVLVEETTSAPGEGSQRLLSLESDVDRPERLGYEGLNALILIDYESERRELAGACRERRGQSRTRPASAGGVP